MKKNILRPNGTVYMQVAYTADDFIEFRDFTANGVTVRFTADALDQMIPFLNEINFWKTVKEKYNETKDEDR